MRQRRLDRGVDVKRDHVLGTPQAEITLLEYGSYACPYCRAVHEVIADLRDRFGERMRYVFRQLPISGGEEAAQLAEYGAETTGEFWEIHDALMKQGPVFDPGDLERIGQAFNLPPRDAQSPSEVRAARRIEEDIRSARRSGATTTPTFFINGRRYEGAWDESALAEAMIGSLGHRIHSATLDFVRWGPSAGVLLLLMSMIALIAANSPFGNDFASAWHLTMGLQLNGTSFMLPVIDWINHGLLTIFFLVVGLEIKREFTVGRLSTGRAAALPIAASVGGMMVPALIYIAVIGRGPLLEGWGVPIATDTAFAVALIAFLGRRVPVELRVFLTAAVVVDDLIAIAVVAVFYSEEIDPRFIAAAAAVIGLLVLLNRGGVYRALPYAMLGVILWILLHEGGLHATLAGVVLAIVTPTRPPADWRALLAQAEMVIQAESSRPGGGVMRHGPSEPALEALDAIHDRIESPANKLHRSMEPWSSYVVLPLFALANAGVTWSAGLLDGHESLVLAIVLGLVAGKPIGIAFFAWLAVLSRLAEKPSVYSWRQLAGAGAVGGIGFTMSLFIAGQSFPDQETFAAAKVAIFLASLIAAALGAGLLWTGAERPEGEDNPPR